MIKAAGSRRLRRKGPRPSDNGSSLKHEFAAQVCSGGISLAGASSVRVSSSGVSIGGDTDASISSVLRLGDTGTVRSAVFRAPVLRARLGPLGGRLFGMGHAPMLWAILE